MTEQIFIGFDYINDYEIVENITINLKNQIKFKWFTEKEKLLKKNEDDLKKWIKKELKNTKKTIIFVWYYTLNIAYIQYIIKESEAKKNEIIKIPLHKEENDYFKLYNQHWRWWVWSLWWWFTIYNPEI
jgi:hypothetical protein